MISLCLQGAEKSDQEPNSPARCMGLLGFLLLSATSPTHRRHRQGRNQQDFLKGSTKVVPGTEERAILSAQAGGSNAHIPPLLLLSHLTSNTSNPLLSVHLWLRAEEQRRGKNEHEGAPESCPTWVFRVVLKKGSYGVFAVSSFVKDRGVLVCEAFEVCYYEF